MGHRRPRAATMAELAVAARGPTAAGDLHGDRPVEAVAPDDAYAIELGSRRYEVRTEPELTAEEAQALATTSRLVVRDPCGCGGGCGYETWTGTRATQLVRSGLPVVEHGELLALLDPSGAPCGVLVVQDAGWGRRRRGGR